MYMRMCMCIACGALRFHQGGNWGMSTANKLAMFEGSSGRICPTTTSIFTTATVSNGKTNLTLVLATQIRGLAEQPICFML